MGYRSSKRRLEAVSAWHAFIAGNSKTIEQSGLPSLVTKSIKLWDDFLTLGYLDHPLFPDGFRVDQLSEDQYAGMLKFVQSYFARGYEYFTPVILRDKDLRDLEMRYRNR